MNKKPLISDLGENRIIKIIEKLILQKTGKPLVLDDAFFFDLNNQSMGKSLVLNSDMLVADTDAPKEMSYYQIGRKSVIMNVSDLIVKGVKPRGIIISLGLPNDLSTDNFTEMINGIIECSVSFDLDYIGGDINETEEFIINPTVFGFENVSKIIYRQGINPGDVIAINSKFGLTGVGFDILLKKKEDLTNFSTYKRSIMSILEPTISVIEAFTLAENELATASIDSSDGLSKSLRDLTSSNQNIGFEIDFNKKLIDQEAVKYSKEFQFSLENLVFNGGEEFIHIFCIKPQDFSKAANLIQERNGTLFKV
ncbi:MAG: thiamine-phosphate kinase, partial [Promethearchaeota archaeon]